MSNTTTAAISDACLDHVILLLDTPDFENPPAWLADNFNIIEGGTHAGELSKFVITQANMNQAMLT